MICLTVMDQGKLVMEGTPAEVFSQRDSLKEIGLDVPPIVDLLYSLKEAGLQVSTEVLDLEVAADEIARALKND